MRLVTMKFSASQTTAKVVDQLCTGLGLPRRDLNLNEGASLGPQDCLIAAFPVFSGRLPAFFKAWMDQIQGRDTPAVAVVVYGNRAYEDALLELSDALEAAGFTIVGAATVVAQHSIFPAVANGPLQKTAACPADCDARCAAFDFSRRRQRPAGCR